MAKFLNTSGITHQLEEIIKGSQGSRLLLISPYLKFNTRIKDLLEDQAQRWKTNIYIVYGKNELRPEETRWLADNFVRTSFRENLHAKCYMNDTHALVTSMNLYEFSQVNNDEMGILASANDDPELYRAIRDEADLILRRSENVRPNVTQTDHTPTPVSAPRPAKAPQTMERASIPDHGFCLRCNSAISFNPSHPYCQPDYRSWSRFKNQDYEEKHCHACGKEHATTLAKPLCLSCWNKYQGAPEAKDKRQQPPEAGQQPKGTKPRPQTAGKRR